MTHASVFSGIGGPEVAATMLGWENLFHCEINPFGRAVLDYWYPNSKSYEDITKTDFTEWRGRVNVLTGGFPCQPFSYAGQRRGATDDRYLWPYMFRCIDQVRPDWVVAENVAGILTMVEQGEVSALASQAALFDEGDSLRRYQLRETFTLQRICDDLEGHGYAVQPVLIPACGVGAPHRRDRVFIVGHRKGDTSTITEGECGERLRPEQSEDSVSWSRIFGGTDSETCSGGGSADTCSEGLEGSRGERIQGNQGGGSTTSDDEPSWADTEDASRNARQIRWSPADPNIYRMEGDVWPQFCEEPQSGLFASQSPDGHGNLRPECRWFNFPTVSPVHRGNDGLPFPVDSLTLPFSKWRTEALKAYGNAIVPQVMYEIFRAIEQVEQAR